MVDEWKQEMECKCNVHGCGFLRAFGARSGWKPGAFAVLRVGLSFAVDKHEGLPNLVTCTHQTQHLILTLIQTFRVGLPYLHDVCYSNLSIVVNFN